MAARHPASHRAQHPDARPQRLPHPRPRAHHSSGSPVPYSSDAEGGTSGHQLWLPPLRTDPAVHHSEQPASDHRHSPTYVRGRDGPHDYGFIDIMSTQRSVQLPRDLPNTVQTLPSAPDEARHGQYNRQAHVGTLGPQGSLLDEHAQRRLDAQQGRNGEDEGMPFVQGTRGESARGPPGGVRAAATGFENLDSRGSSATGAHHPQHPLRPPPLSARPMSSDEETPYIPPSGSALFSQSVYNFNRERYPAYDEQARRIGLEHTRHESTPSQPGSYYRARTHHYPPANVTAADYPHVMNIDLNVASPSTPATAGQHPGHRVYTPPLAPDSDSASDSEPDPDPEQNEDREHDHNDSEIESETIGDVHARRGDSPSRHSSTEVTSPLAEHLDELDVSHTGEMQAGHDASGEQTPDGPAVNSTPYLRAILGLAPDQEVSLKALADPPEGERPNYPYPTLIKLAIHGSRHKRLALQEIYQAVMDRFEYYKKHKDDTSWKNSIRHNLSLNKCFRSVDRPITEPGKGRLWIVDYSEGEGNKRERKRNKKPTKAAQRKAQEDAFRAEHESAASGASSAVEVGAQEDRRRPVANDRSRTPADANNNAASPSVEYSFVNENRLEARPPSSTSIITSRMSDAHIDPILREGGHIAGEGRMRPPRSYSRRSSTFLPPVQIRQSARVSARHHTSESGGSHSPSPPVASARVVHPPLGHPTGAPPSGRGRPAAPEHRFGQGSLGGVTTQYTIPGPMNWTPYGSNLQQSPRPTAHTADNALLLSGVPNNTAAPSTRPAAGQGPPPPQPHHEASASRLPISNYRENSRASSRRTSRRVYTDSRGIEYPSNGQDSYSSGSD